MTLAKIVSTARKVIAISLVPTSIIGGVWAALWAINSGIDPIMVVFPISLASLVLVAVMERILPYRREWNRSHGDIRTDTLYYLTQIFVGGLLSPVLAILTIIIGGWLSARMGGSIWPYSWPILAQVLLASVVREFFDYWAHRSMHEFDWLWRMHATHHSALRVYWLNATRAHPGEIAYRFCFVWVLPLALLGVPPKVLALATVAAVVADAFQHANIAIRLGPLSWIFSIGDLHRWHHSRQRRESDTNYGNVYIFWDVVFGTRYLPKDRTPPARVGIGGMDAFPAGFFAQWLSPFRWQQIRQESSGTAQGTGSLKTDDKLTSI
jgi:sterol desaturase/sphingolipid hydroxylase (fatty acid hydroxylase superfamily)